MAVRPGFISLISHETFARRCARLQFARADRAPTVAEPFRLPSLRRQWPA